MKMEFMENSRGFFVRRKGSQDPWRRHRAVHLMEGRKRVREDDEDVVETGSAEHVALTIKDILAEPNLDERAKLKKIHEVCRSILSDEGDDADGADGEEMEQRRRKAAQTRARQLREVRQRAQTPEGFLMELAGF